MPTSNKNSVYLNIRNNITNKKIKTFPLNYQTKKSDENESYFYITLNEAPPKKKHEIIIDSKEYIITDYHFTVFEYLRKNESDAAFHITINLTHDNKTYTARIYYDEHCKKLSLTFKECGKLLHLNKESDLLWFVEPYVLEFSGIIETMHENVRNEFKNQYNQLLNNLSAKSLAIDLHINQKEKKEAYIEYRNALEEAISIISYTDMPFYCNTQNFISIFKNLLGDVTTELDNLNDDAVNIHNIDEDKSGQNQVKINIAMPKRKLLSVSAVSEEIKVIDEQIKKIQINNELNEYQKIIKEYTLLDYKYKTVNESGDALSVLNKMNELEKKVGKILTSILILSDMILKNDQTKLTENSKINQKSVIEDMDFTALVIINKNNVNNLIKFAVKNNKPSELKLILEALKPVNLNIKTNALGESSEQYLLQIAYDHHFDELFEILLLNGAFPDIRYNEKTIVQKNSLTKINELVLAYNKLMGDTLLIRSCKDNRIKAMTVLVRNGANLYYKPTSAAGQILTYAPFVKNITNSIKKNLDKGFSKNSSEAISFLKNDINAKNLNAFLKNHSVTKIEKESSNKIDFGDLHNQISKDIYNAIDFTPFIKKTALNFLKNFEDYQPSHEEEFLLSIDTPFCFEEQLRILFETIDGKDLPIFINQLQGLTNQESTLLYLACDYELEYAVQLLLQHGANPNIHNYNHANALDVCIQKNNLNILEIILKDSQVDIIDTALYSPLAIARESKNSPAEHLLNDYAKQKNIFIDETKIQSYENTKKYLSSAKELKLLEQQCFTLQNNPTFFNVLNTLKTFNALNTQTSDNPPKPASSKRL
ncbi:MAG: hypothetical protein LEGION0403_FIIPPAGN_00850 [Legionella sp.]|uniref:ankyrin repeat domain-containing protein n=1 Tax=Legionella sp. TaxID=459 RepID=UPI003D0A1CDF